MNNMYDIIKKINLLEGQGSKPDFLDLDKDGNRTEPMKQAAKQAKEVDEGSTGDYSAKKARAGKDIGKPGKQFAKIAKSAAERYGSKERGEKVAGAVLAKLRAKESIDEADMEEGNEFSGALAKAKASGAKEFEVDGKTYAVKESARSHIKLIKEAKQGDGLAQVYHDREYDEFHVKFVKEGTDIEKYTFVEDLEEAASIATTWLAENDPNGMCEDWLGFQTTKDMYKKIGAEVDGTSDDYTVTYRDGTRKRFQEKEPGRRTVTNLEPKGGWDRETDGAEPVKRGRGRPRKYSADKPRQERVTARSRKKDRTAWTPDRKKAKEDVAEDYDKDEYDEEGEMAKTQARTIEDAAKELQAILSDEENLPEWVQSKITKAMDYLDTARDYLAANRPEEEMMAEKAVSQAQRKAAGIAYAAQKGEIPKSELRGASKEMAKMPKKELKKFASTKEKDLPEKKKEESVEETTTSGSVATAPTSGKAKGIFGKGIYEGKLEEAFQAELKKYISEGTTITISAPDEGEPSVNVTGTGEDAIALQQLLQMAGLFASSGYHETCPACGQSPCGCAEVVDEELANSADNTETMDVDYMTQELSGGLNGPKSTGQTTVPVINRDPARQSSHEQIDEEAVTKLMDLYKRIDR